MKRTKFKTGILAVVFCSLTFLFSGDGNSIYAVSYTHLDVYKRQAQAYGYTEKSSVFKERLGFYPMNWLNKLERKIGRYAVPNLIIWLIGAYTIGYVFGTVSPGILSYLTLKMCIRDRL